MRERRNSGIKREAGIASETDDCPPFGCGELIKALKTVKNRILPGLDLFEVEVLESAVRERPEVFLRLFNVCLNKGYFPRNRKE